MKTSTTTFISAFLCVFLMPAFALAGDTEGAWISVVGSVLPLLVSAVIVPGLVWLGKKLAGLIDRNVENKLLGKALAMVNMVVGGVVTTISQDMADAFKAAAADGKLTDEEKKSLKDLALTRVKELLISGKTWDTLVESFGSEQKAEDFVSGEIEKAVRFSKEMTKVVSVPSVTNIVNSAKLPSMDSVMKEVEEDWDAIEDEVKDVVGKK